MRRYGCPSPQPTRGLDNVCKLPNGVRGEALAKNEFVDGEI